MAFPSLLYIFPFPTFFSSTTTDHALPYTQLPATDLLILVSFLFLLNGFRVVADYFAHAGIIAEIFLGIVYGTPLAAILPQAWETCFTALGYLGLIGIVCEGGLSTELAALLSNLPLSIVCALTGIALPVALSFALLQGGYGFKPLEAFAAGAALSSTSLGTTLMALNSVSSSKTTEISGVASYEDGKHNSQKDCVNIETRTDISRKQSNASSTEVPLQRTRIGTVLISAAVIDDVIGLILASLVPALSILNANDEERSATPLAWTIIRPLLSSTLMALITPIVARFVLRPVLWYRGWGETWCAPRQSNPAYPARTVVSQIKSRWGSQSQCDAVKLTLAILCVSAFSSIAFYTGSSVLFGAYLAGLTLSYVARPSKRRNDDEGVPHGVAHESLAVAMSFEAMYSRTIGPLQEAILAPLFFASIGFSIPFRSLWRPTIIWRGVIYTLLMCIGKLATGIPIILWSTLSRKISGTLECMPALKRKRRASPTEQGAQIVKGPSAMEMTQLEPAEAKSPNLTSNVTPPSSHLRQSLIPALFMGVAMVSRGEIGLLIVQVAHGTGEANSAQMGLLSDDAFSICVWAIVLCTLIGPIGVGFVVKRYNSSVRSVLWG